MSAEPLPAVIREGDLAPTPIARARTIPAAWYHEPSVHRFEMRTLFRDAWQVAGHCQGLDAAGAYRVTDIAGAPVILARGADGGLRAFFNVCRHRAGPVARGEGQCRLFRCRYHGWVYDLEGRLVRAPEIGDIEDFDAADFRLSALDIRQWGPLVFVASQARAASASPDLSATLGNISARVPWIDPDALRFARRESYDVACNWKVYVDNYLEGYHLPMVHPELTGILDYRDYSSETRDGFSLQYSAIENPTTAYASGEACYYYIFPNSMLNILPGRVQSNLVVPLGADRCRVVFDYYYQEGAGAADDASMEEDARLADLIQRQDIDICERVQRGLESGVYTSGRYSVSREQCVHHFHQLLRSAYSLAG